MDIDDLFISLQSPDEDVRKSAIERLERNTDMRAIPALMKLSTSDESLEVRFLAKKVLNKYRQQIRAGDWEQSKESPPQKPGPATGSAPGVLPPGVDELSNVYEQLQGTDPKTRIQAIMALVQLKAPDALRRLRRLEVKEDKPKVRAALVLALGLIGGEAELDMIKGFLAERNPRVRCNAIEALRRLGGDSCVADIAQALKDRSRRVKDQALSTLKEVRPAVLVAALQNMLTADEKDSRDAAAYALLKLEMPETLPLIVGLLSDAEMTIRLKARNALVTLAKKGCKEAAEALERLAGKRATPDDFMTISVLERRPHLQQLCDPKPRERMKAIATIIESSDSKRVPHLLQALLIEKDAFVRAKLVIALGRLKAREAIPTLKLLASDKDDRIRANAVEALGDIGESEVFPFIVPFLEDENNRVRANAIVALRTYQLVKLDIPLKTMVTHKDPLMRRSAIWAITEVRSPRYVNLLKHLLSDGDKKVKRQAVEAVKLLAAEGFAEAVKVSSHTGMR